MQRSDLAAGLSELGVLLMDRSLYFENMMAPSMMLPALQPCPSWQKSWPHATMNCDPSLLCGFAGHCGGVPFWHPERCGPDHATGQGHRDKCSHSGRKGAFGEHDRAIFALFYQHPSSSVANTAVIACTTALFMTKVFGTASPSACWMQGALGLPFMCPRDFSCDMWDALPLMAFMNLAKLRGQSIRQVRRCLNKASSPTSRK